LDNVEVVSEGIVPLDSVVEIIDLGHEIFSNMPTLGAPTTFWSEDRHESLAKLTSGRFSLRHRSQTSR